MCEDNLSPYGVLDLNGSKGCREAEEDGREESKDKDSHALAAGVQVTRSSRVGAFIPLSPAGFNRQSTVLKVDMTLNNFWYAPNLEKLLLNKLIFLGGFDLLHILGRWHVL